jgi:hypothetical protein
VFKAGVTYEGYCTYCRDTLGYCVGCVGFQSWIAYQFALLFVEEYSALGGVVCVDIANIDICQRVVGLIAAESSIGYMFYGVGYGVV